MNIDKQLLTPKMFYFCWFASIGALVPFISLFYRHSGLDLGQIGVLASLPGLIQIVAAPVWGLFADMLRLRRTILPLALAGTILPVLLISRVQAFGWLFLFVTLQALFTAPIVSLADSATLTLLGDQRERYGAQRMWGAVGWGLSTLFFGRLLTGLGLTTIFWGYAGLCTLAFAAALLLPRTEFVQTDMRAAIRTLRRDRRWFGFLGCVLLIGFCSSTISSFLSLYLQDLGANDAQIGLAYTIASISEMPVMMLSPLVLRRWGARPLLITAGLLYGIRAIIYIFAPSPGVALAAQLLHGPCFAALWTAGVVEAQRLAPPGLEATAQSLLGMAFFAIASALASAVGGQIYRDLGTTALFGVAAALALTGAAGLLISSYTQITSQRANSGRQVP